MPRLVSALSILPRSRRAAEVWHALGEVLRSHGAAFEPGTLVILNDHEGRDPEPEDAQSEEEAVSRILDWPTLGGVSFGFTRQYVTIFTFGELLYQADAITVSTMSKAYLLDADFKTSFDRLVADVHRATNASRTISEYELLSPDSFWIDELERVRAGRFEGSYAVDLR
jgi:hypothetical protein